MFIENPVFVGVLAIVVIFQIAYIILDSKEHFKYFRDFMDAIILLTFILCAYFIFEYIRARRIAPTRGEPPITEVLAQKKLKQQTNRQVTKLQNSEAYKKFAQEKLKRLKQQNKDQPQLNETDASFLKELQQKETQIFDSK